MELRILAGWLLLLGLAIANGVVREQVIAPRTRRGVALALSTVMLSALIVAAGWVVTPWIGPRTLQDAWTIGAAWVTLTLAFEFLAGHYLFGRTWQELLADYNLLAGRIWIMVLIVTLMTPVVAFTRANA